MTSAESQPHIEPWEASLLAGEESPPTQLDTRWWQSGYITYSDGSGGVITVSTTMISVEDRQMPEFVNFKIPLVAMHVPGDPWLLGQIKVCDGTPRCVSLAFTSDQTGREIRQSDLRDVGVNTLVIELMATFSTRVDQSDPLAALRRINDPGEAFSGARRFVERRRRGPGLRDITPELLERVAEVYRANFDHAPTEAVAKTFGVKSRMASTYVQRARAAGYLPPTKQGKKHA